MEREEVWLHAATDAIQGLMPKYHDESMTRERIVDIAADIADYVLDEFDKRFSKEHDHLSRMR